MSEYNRDYMEGYVHYRLGLYETYLITLVGNEMHLFYQLGYSRHCDVPARLMRLAND